VSIRDRFRPVKLRGSGIDALIGRGVLAPPAVITASLVIVNNVYKYVFI
jgi:hypothetical protein